MQTLYEQDNAYPNKRILSAVQRIGREKSYYRTSTKLNDKAVIVV